MDTPDIVNRAIHSICPEYFSWDETKREIWRVTKGQKKRKKFQKFIMRKDLGLSKKKTAKIIKGHERHGLKPKEQERLNFLDLFYSGIGEDKVVCNELSASDFTLLTYANLGVYDRDQFNFQSIARYKDLSSPLDTPYVGDLHGSWFRTLRNNDLCYTHLFMLHSYIHSTLEEKFSEMLDARVPHTWEEGPKHMQQTSQGHFIHDMKVNANGLEEEYNTLRHASHQALWAIAEEVGREMAQSPLGMVWVEDAESFGPPDEQNVNVVFSDPDVLERIRFSRFWHDVHKLAQPLDQLRELEQKSVDKMTQWFEEECRKLF